MTGRPSDRIRLLLAMAAFAAAAWPAPGLADVSDYSQFGGLSVTVPVAHDSHTEQTAFGIDANLILFVFNGGVSYRHWDGAVEGWNGNSSIRNETTVYAGVGFVNLLQVQFGYSATGTSFRARSDIVLFGDEHTRAWRGVPGLLSSAESRWGPVRKGLVVSPFVESSPWSDRRVMVYGVGLGVVF